MNSRMCLVGSDQQRLDKSQLAVVARCELERLSNRTLADTEWSYIASRLMELVKIVSGWQLAKNDKKNERNVGGTFENEPKAA